MSTDMTWETLSTASEDTEKLGKRLGRSLKGGEMIELISDLGGGKTTFTRGLVRGTGITDTVASPTFTISKVYKKPGLEVYHFDFYRLQEAGIVAAELAEVAGMPDTVTVVEWGDIVQAVLPKERLRVQITLNPDGTRRLRFTAPEAAKYLIEAVKG